MSNYVTIRQAVVDKINADKVKIAQAYISPTSTIESFPAVIVEPTGHKSEYENTRGTRERVYQFELTGYYAFNSESGQENADLALDEVADELIGMFDESNALSASGVRMVSPASTEWGYFETDEGVYRYVRLTIECRVIKTC